MTLASLMIGLATVSAGYLPGDEPSTSPRPIPLTRPETKQLLEDMKTRKPRIPLPPLTEEEKAQIAERAAVAAGNIAGAGNAAGYEGRLRSLYMPAGDRGGAGVRGNAAGTGVQGSAAGGAGGGGVQPRVVRPRHRGLRPAAGEGAPGRLRSAHQFAPGPPRSAVLAFVS